MKYAHGAESNEKSIFAISMFRVMVDFVLKIQHFIHLAKKKSGGGLRKIQTWVVLLEAGCHQQAPQQVVGPTSPKVQSFANVSEG